MLTARSLETILDPGSRSKWAVYEVHASTKQNQPEDFNPSSSSSLQFSSDQDGIYVLGKAHVRSTPSLRSFANVAFETVPMLD